MGKVIDINDWRWTDLAGRVHAVDSAEVVPSVTLRWTRCGLFDVPHGEGKPGAAPLTCAACRLSIDMDPFLPQ